MSAANVAEQLEESEHATLSPSGAATWFNCPGSHAAQQGLPDSTSEFAAEGTVAHHVAALCKTSGARPDTFLHNVYQQDGYSITVDHEMVHHVEAYIDYLASIETLYADEKPVTAVEHRVYTAVEECYGTADFLLYAPTSRHLHVVDLKYGKGKRVDVDDNLQMMIYGWAAGRGIFKQLGEFPVRITLHVFQPRINNVVKRHYTLDEFAPWVEKIERAARAALAPDAPRVPGEAQCQWCKAKPTCPELGRYVDETVTQQFPIAALEQAVDAGALATAMSRVDLVKAWVKSVEDKVYSLLNTGAPVPGYKLVAGRSLRKWGGSDEDIEAALRKRKFKVADIFTRSLKTPAALEKELGKKVFSDKVSDLVVKPEGRPVIAAESDPRPAVTTGDTFPDLT